MNNLTLGGANWQQYPPGYVFLPSPVPPAMQSLEAHVGGLDLDVTDAKSKLEERQSFESDSSRWLHATTKLEDDNGVEDVIIDPIHKTLPLDILKMESYKSIIVQCGA
jgi:hypothetical protein